MERSGGMTVSDREVRASDLHTLETLGRVELPGWLQIPVYRGLLSFCDLEIT